MPGIFSTEFLTDAECRSLATARSQIARSLAGRMRWAYELATGAFNIDGDAPRSGVNPSGNIGVDRSGYPWGAALQHPLWIGDGCRVAAGVIGARPFLTVGTSELVVIARVVVKPFLLRPLTPYSRGYFRANISRSAGTPTTTVTMKSQRGRESSAVITAIGANPTIVFPTLWVDLVPGVNIVEIRFTPSTGVPIVISGCSINQIVERTH